MLISRVFLVYLLFVVFERDVKRDGKVSQKLIVVSTSCRQILIVESGETRRCKINLDDEHEEF
jgi:hypothetical protein